MGTAPSMTVEENLVLGAVRGTAPGLRRAVRRARRDTFRSVLAGFGLDLGERLEARGRELSGGQRQALSLAIATFVQPRLLLLDEHVASLDPRMTDVVMTMTDNLVRGQGLTTLMVTHNLRHALTFGARLLIMHRGGIVEDLDGKRRSALTSSQLTARFADLAEQNHVGRSKAEER